jgi:hypothetical protein
MPDPLGGLYFSRRLFVATAKLESVIAAEARTGESKAVS